MTIEEMKIDAVLVNIKVMFLHIFYNGNKAFSISSSIKASVTNVSTVFC